MQKVLHSIDPSQEFEQARAKVPAKGLNNFLIFLASIVPPADTALIL